jgi:hypothetical protein
MTLIPGPDFETGSVDAKETIDLKSFLPKSKVIIQSAFYGLDKNGDPAPAQVADDGKSVMVTVLPEIQGISLALVTPSMKTETVSLGQPGTVFATPTVIGGTGEGVVIIKGVKGV